VSPRVALVEGGRRRTLASYLDAVTDTDCLAEPHLFALVLAEAWVGVCLQMSHGAIESNTEERSGMARKGGICGGI
jgi:hypothetical protein